MTERAEPMTADAVADLVTECIEATVRRDKQVVEAAMDRVFLHGTPEDGLRFGLGCIILIAEMLTPSQAARAKIAGEWAARGLINDHPGEVLFLLMLADVVGGNENRAMRRWVHALIADAGTENGAPGYAVGAALRQAAVMVVASRARLQ